MTSRDNYNDKKDQNGGGISPMEMESLTQSEDQHNSNDNSNGNTSYPAGTRSFLPDHPCDKLLLLIKLYFELYPRLMYGASGVLLVLLLGWWSPWSSYHVAQRNYMTRDYSNLQNDFNFKAAQIDHWCLFGGDDRCYCEDPMEGNPRSEAKGWNEAHNRNKQLVDLAVAEAAGTLDVVFLGDQTVQSWDGTWMDKPAPEGKTISKYWNSTFHSEDATFQGLALGIYGDRLNNILWRIQHGEMPPSLNAKVFWLIMGTNDLALGLCSEEVVTLGIMRVAEEIHHHYPNSIVVIQGILPRSNHRDGSLEGITRYSSTNAGGTKRHHWYSKPGGAGLKRDPVPDTTFLPPRHHERALEMENMAQEQLERDLQSAPTTSTGSGGSSTTETTTTGSSTASGTTTGGSTTRTSSGGSPSLGQAATATTSTSTTSSNANEPTYGVTKSKYSPYAYDKWAKQNNYVEHEAPQPKYDYYLWPSIKHINKELESFCAKHDHLVYFDADELVLGSIGNAHYKAPSKSIITELMPNYVHLSPLGHKVVIGAIKDELQRIIYDDDEQNDIETKEGSVRKSGGS